MAAVTHVMTDGVADQSPAERSRSLRLWAIVGAACALALTCALSLAVGSKPVALSDVIAAFTSFDDTDPSHLIVREIRLPRMFAGLLVGAGLGLAGAVMQGVTRNPLADPGILGVNAGAALAVVSAIFLFDVSAPRTYVWFSFVGAAAASVVVYALGARGRGGATPIKLALAGAAVTAFLTSFTTAILMLDSDSLDEFRFWVVGSLVSRDTTVVRNLAPFVIVGILAAATSAKSLNALSMGEDVARSLGENVSRARILAAVTVTLLTGASVAIAGPIGFIGLTIPHAARAVTGPDYRWVLPLSMLLGPTLLLAADVVGRVVARPTEVQVGIMTALVGTPFFVYIVRRKRLAQL
jgi:iron complex transport system permease protein